MAARIYGHDWASTPLGPLQAWPNCLTSAVEIMLPSQAQIVMFWGSEFIALYNDAYAPTIGDKHPTYRYEREVEDFFRHSPAVVRPD